MTIRTIDIHSHLYFPEFDQDRNEVIAEMKTQGIGTITVGTDEESSRQAVVLANTHEHIYATVGIHPTHIADKQQPAKKQVSVLVKHGDGGNAAFDEPYFESLLGPKVVAVGECGLDYFRMRTDLPAPRLRQAGADETQTDAEKESQRLLFVKQIEFAQKHSLPLMIHGRPSTGTMDAYEDIIHILTPYYDLRPTNYSPGNIHFFVGDIPTAQKFLELGFSLSFDGPITFTHDYDEVIRFIPKDMLMAETDAPFVAPVPYRGKRNSPLYVSHIIERLAEIRGTDPEALNAQMLENARRIFRF